jgi:hypothetical protein
VSPVSAPVLVGAALVSSPALYGALVDGTTTLESAFVRYLVCVVLCWAALAAVELLVGPPPRPTADPPADAPAPESEPVG